MLQNYLKNMLQNYLTFKNTSVVKIPSYAEKKIMQS